MYFKCFFLGLAVLNLLTLGKFLSFKVILDGLQGLLFEIMLKSVLNDDILDEALGYSSQKRKMNVFPV